MDWYSFDRRKLLKPIEHVVEAAILRELELGNKLKICIGCDSQVKSNIIEFATVIVVLREKKGGFIYYSMMKKNSKMTIKERMIFEVGLSVQLAYQLCPILDRYPIELEVHADINTDPNFGSNIALREATGYILGMGYTFKAKPDAFASSYCADRLVH
ncbi:MAG: ribonuclease H-like YkuK family protein [Saprospiraceae bacterium]